MIFSHYFDSCSFFKQFRMSLILVVIGSLLLGMAMQYLLDLTKHLSLKGEIKSLKKELSEIPVRSRLENADKTEQSKSGKVCLSKIEGEIMFTREFGLMFYVDDVAAEKEFWTAAGFTIFNETEMMGYETFDMKPHPEATTTITVYAKEFIRQVSPEVIDMKPSILFETDDIEGLQARIAGLTDTCSPVNTEPFPNFNFASPSGHYFAVKG